MNDDQHDQDGADPTARPRPTPLEETGAGDGRPRDGSSPPPGDAEHDDDGIIEIVGFEAADEAGVALEVESDDQGTVELERARQDLDRLRNELDEQRQRAATAEAEVAEQHERLQRVAAELENFRKRVARDRVEEKKQAAARLVKDLLPVTDSFQRALDQAEAHAEGEPGLRSFIDGVRLIETQLFDILQRAGLEPVPSEGAFDPTFHEALMQEPTTEAPHMSVLEIFEKGYLFGGRLLRPARVKVAVNPTPTPSATGDEDRDDAEPESAEVGEAGESAVEETAEKTAEDLGDEAAPDGERQGD